MIYIGIDLGKSGALAMIESSPSPPQGTATASLVKHRPIIN